MAVPHCPLSRAKEQGPSCCDNTPCTSPLVALSWPERLSLSPLLRLGPDSVPWLGEGPVPTTELGWGCGREHLCPDSCDPAAETSYPELQSCGGRAWALAHHSQLRDVLGDPLGQGLEVLVAAADNGVEAGALLRALGPGDAAGLLLTCTGQRATKSLGPSPQAPCEAGLNALCPPRTAPLPCRPSPHPQSRVLQAGASYCLWAIASAQLRVSSAEITPVPRNCLPQQDGCNQPGQGCSDFHHFQAKMQSQGQQRGGLGRKGSALQILLK